MPARTPLVSVVLASFNHEAYVEEAVRSVLAQTYERLELIVVDDGSTDATPDVVATIHDPRLRLIRLPTNRATHPRNVGLGEASGRLVAFQNSDDVWHPDKLSAQVQALVEDPRLVASFTRVDIIDAVGNPAADTFVARSFRRELESSAAWLQLFFDTGNDLCLSSAVCRRKAIERVGGFDPSLFDMSDFDLWIRLAGIGELRVVPRELTSMRVVGERNLSAPTPATLRRSHQEYALVLDRFTQRPVYRRLPEILPELLDADMRRPVRLALLARHSWERPDVSHQLFGDRLFARLLRTPGYRERITRRLGTHLIAEFLQARGRLEVVRHD
jgi:glycosyltransferase involved in cell wall biosynthesis